MSLMNFVNSLRETFTEFVIDLFSIAKIDLMAYPGLVTADDLSILARLLLLASQVGLSRKQVSTILMNLEKHGNPGERLGEMENHIEIFMQSPNHPVPLSLFNMLGLAARPFQFTGFTKLISQSNIYYMPHFMSERLAYVWERTKIELSRSNYNLDGLVIVGDMWELLN